GRGNAAPASSATPHAAAMTPIHSIRKTLSARVMALLAGEKKNLIFQMMAFVTLLMALLSFSRLDPSWSVASEQATIHNWLGMFGAFVADVLYYVIGLSAWWINIVQSFRHKQAVQEDRKVGEIVEKAREEKVNEYKARYEDHQPVQIIRNVKPVKIHERVEVEKQQVLFRDESRPELPPISLLDPPEPPMETVSEESMAFTSKLIEKKLADYNIDVQVVSAYPGPVVTRYEIEPASGIRGSQIVNLSKDLARALSVSSIRVVETIPGKNLMALELPNPVRQMVRLSEIIGSEVYNDSTAPLTIALGKDIAGVPIISDLAKMPHCLVAGTTGSGKSVGINATILSLVYKSSPDEVKLILVDPKMLELSVYEGIPHLICPVVTDMNQAANALNWAVKEMERRNLLMSKMGVRNLAGLNKKIDEAIAKEEPLLNPLSLTPDAPEPLKKQPYIVVIIDELADLIMVVGKKVEEPIARIAQKARAAGIHMILATQRPSVDVITGLIKANVPTRIAFQVSSKIDSRTILDQQGAESLLGMGDMLFLPPGTGVPLRVHGAFVSDDEVHRVAEELRKHGSANYLDEILTGGEKEDGDFEVGEGGSQGEADPMYDKAVQVVLKTGRASISRVQRELGIGFNRAAKLLEAMEQAGLVSSMARNGSREILVSRSVADDDF
ncbi:unnamed protein product, partial [Darwinula stevensoni]